MADPNLIVFPAGNIIARRFVLDGLLAEGVAGVPVVTRVPATRPARFVRVTAAPGRELSMVQKACVVTAQCYSDNEVQCARDAELVAAILRRAPFNTVDGVFWVTAATHNTGPYEWPDPDLPATVYRYQVVVDWVVRAQT